MSISSGWLSIHFDPIRVRLAMGARADGTLQAIVGAAIVAAESFDIPTSGCVLDSIPSRALAAAFGRDGCGCAAEGGRQPFRSGTQTLRHQPIYSVHAKTRKSFGLMTRKLSVTESQ